MEEVIRELEHTIQYFENAQTDFQRGRVFEAKKVLEALRQLHSNSSFCNCETIKTELHYSYCNPVCFKCNKVVKLTK